MEITNKTVEFYGDLIQAGIAKDVFHMVELISSLNKDQVSDLCIALINITDMATTISRVRENGN